MQDADRAFLLQVFQHRSSSDKVIVVGGHFPHGWMNNEMSAAVQSAFSSNPASLGVILAADTNRPAGVSTAQIMSESMGISSRIVASQLFPTCCNNDGFVNHYDRVAATFGVGMQTEMLFNPQPWWAIEGEFHKALLVTLQVGDDAAGVSMV